MSDPRHRFHEIDLLRGLACAAVVAFHYLSRGPRAGWMDNALFPAFDAIARYGYLGVHLFFMISGFVILLSAQGATPRSFVASRVARLYPAFWVAATITALTAWMVENSRFMVSPPQYLANLTMFPHWFNVPYVDGAYWSLAVELHFYIYVWLALRLKVFHRTEWLLAAWLAISAINALRPMWPVEFWLNAKWAPLFVAGGAFFLIRTHGASLGRLGLLLCAYGLALVYAVREVANVVGDDGSAHFRSEVIVVLVSVFFAVFALIAWRRWTVRDSWFVSLLGALTYPMYLLHQNLGYMLHGRLDRWVAAPWTLLFVAGIVGMLAWGVHRRVEKTLGPRLKAAVLKTSI